MRLSLMNCASIAIVMGIVGSATVCAAPYEQEVLADNPFVYYRFDETEGDVAADSSGNGHDAIYVDVELGDESAGAGLGTAARFDGSTSLVDVPALDFESDQLTIETWLNVDFIVGRCCTSVFSPTGWEPGWLHYNLGESGRVEFALNSGGPNDRWTEDDALPLEDWAHVVSTYDADEAMARIFIDGEELEFDIPTFDTPQTVQLVVEAQIGAWQNSRYLSGAIDEFAIYDSVLPDERILAHYNSAFSSVETGDFDGDGEFGAGDINALTAEVAAGTHAAAFDLTEDNLVDLSDMAVWVKNIKQTWFGDANLDGEFNSADLVAVFTVGKFEADEPANWSEGDWNGDARFNSSDFVEAFTDGGFEMGPRVAVAAVPEPSAAVIVLLGFLTAAVSRRSRSL